MTLYGIDIAKYQAGIGLDKVKREGFAWVEARCSTGYQGGTVDPQFQTFKSQAAKNGLLFVAYHFLYPHGTVSIERQAAVCARAIGDKSCPVMIDHEPESGAATPSVADAVEFAAAMRGLGYHVPLWYLPHWVWQDHLNSPILPKTAGMSLVASSYVGGTGYASKLYPGVGHWPSAYGGLTPVIWQFSDNAEVAGQHVDADAFEGSLAQLKQLFAGGQPIKPPAQHTNVDHARAYLQVAARNNKTGPIGRAVRAALNALKGIK